MRAPRTITLLAACMLLACGRDHTRQQQAVATDSGKTLPTVSGGELTAAELAMFGALPARMDVLGQPSTEAQVALGRSLYYETVLSEGHDVSCNSCHPLNA